MKSYLHTMQDIKKELANHYTDGEITSFIAIIFNHIEKLSLPELHLKSNENIHSDHYKYIEKIIQDLKKYKPIQYILGETVFYNCKFKVSPDVLIPRPETEELVDIIIKENKEKKRLKILDIGTGSGCIAIALEKNLDCDMVSAFDSSDKALQIAKKNREINKASVSFFKKDILKIADKRFKPKYDIIISNPPYVTEKEKHLMQRNVLDYEPHKALFVEDNDPFKFYRFIGKFAKNNLASDGKLYFEINEAFGNEIVNLLISLKYGAVTLMKDINGKDRMIKALKS